MREDVWLTVEQASEEMMKRDNVVSVKVRKDRLCAINRHGATVESRRIFDGSEHPLARSGTVCY